MKLSLIVAMTQKARVIGKDNALPWHLPDDLRYFKERTTGSPIIMGRKTFESIGRPLPKRSNIVISQNPHWQAPEGVLCARSLDEAIALAHSAPQKNDEAFVIGGAEIFRALLPRCERLYITWIETEFPGDCFFPELDLSKYREISRQSQSEPHKHHYCVYDKIK